MAEEGRLYCSQVKEVLGGYKVMVEASLSDEQYDKSFLDDVLGVWCCVSGITKPEFSDDERCDLLYYLMGSILYEKLDDKSSFGTLMSGLPKILNTLFHTGEYKIEENKTGEKLFALMEQLGSYSLGSEGSWNGHDDSAKVNCERYATYLQKIAIAYEKVQQQCNATQNEGECDEIKKGYRTYTPQQLYEAMYKVAAALPRPVPQPGAGLGTHQPKTCRQQLPSYEMHDELSNAMEKSECGTSTDTVKTALEGILTKYSSFGNYEEQAMQAYCLASKMEKPQREASPSGKDYCTSLYYWIGYEVFRTMTEPNNFSTAMKEVYTELKKLKGLGTDTSCDVLYDGGKENIPWNIFINMKALYEYTQDYATIQVDLPKILTPGESSTVNCNKEEYYSYLTTAADAYNQMKQHCEGGSGSGTHSDKAWCTEFNRWFHQQRKDVSPSSNPILSPSQLKCKLKHTSDCTNITIPAAVSSGLAAVGLSTIATFLLYKYNLLPSWIRNTFFGGSSNNRMNNGRRRNKRATIQRNFNDTSTETSSTDMSTIYSTIGDSSTTDFITEDSSTIYNGEQRSPHRGRVNINDRKGKELRRPQRSQQRHRNRQQKSRNISYQRI